MVAGGRPPLTCLACCWGLFARGCDVARHVWHRRCGAPGHAARETVGSGPCPVLPDTGLKGQFRFPRAPPRGWCAGAGDTGNGVYLAGTVMPGPLIDHTSGFRPDDLTLIIMLIAGLYVRG